MENIVLEKNNINKKAENIYFLKYIMNNKKINREEKIKNIIKKNRIYKTTSNVGELDKIAYNI